MTIAEHVKPASLIERAKNICLSPTTEWSAIAAEPASTESLILGYAVPLAAIPALAGFIGGSIMGRSLPFVGYYRVPLLSGLVAAVFVFGMSIVGVFVLSLIIDALAPTFGGEKNRTQALKVAVYSYTPAWLAGVLNVVPLLGVLAIFAAFYGLYLLYLGLPRLMAAPEDKALPYSVVVVVCAIVLSIVMISVTGIIAGAGALGAGALGSAIGGGRGPTGAFGSSPSASIQYDKNSALGKLQDLGNKLEESSKKMEAAEKRGDGNAQMSAALEGLGTLLGGGRRVDPIGIDQLKPLVPDTFVGLPRTRSNAERSGLAGLMVSKAEAEYGDGAQKHVTLEISDTGGVSGLVALAGWAGVEEEKADESGSERTQKINGRIVHERLAKTGGPNEFGLVLGDRFVVSAKGNGVSLNELKAAVSALDLGKIESMKDAGVQR